MRKTITLSLLLVLLCTQCSATAKKRSFGEVVDDSVIAVKLRAKYIKEKELPSNRVKVKIWKGVVSLTGQLDTQQQINRIIEIAEQQAGVKEVKAYLVLKGSLETAKNKKSFWPFSKKKKTKKSQVVEEDIEPVVKIEKDNKNKDQSEDFEEFEF